MKIKSFLGSLPGFWLLYESIELALLKSKNPEFFGLYSSDKVLAILILLLMSSVSFRFLVPFLEKFFSASSLQQRLMTISPIKLFLLISVFCRLTLIQLPCEIGEDVAPQVLSGFQWTNGKSSSPNILVTPNPNDLSVDKSKWILRPPGASWIPLPGLLIGLSIGNSILIALFLLGLASGLGWLILAKYLCLTRQTLHFLATFLALGIAVSSHFLTTAAVLTAATFPWFILWALKVGNLWKNSLNRIKTLWQSLLFFLLLGTLAFFKYSSLVMALAIAALPFFTFLVDKRRITFRFAFFAIFGAILFLGSYFVINRINLELTGKNSNDLYTQQNYNLQDHLWGNNMIETTKGKMWIASLMAGTGYASPAQGLIHRFRDFLLQFENSTNWLAIRKINPRIFWCCILAIPISITLFLALWKIRFRTSYEIFLLYFSLFTIPFIGLSIISYYHGFNYIMYHAYTKEFAPIFLIFGLSFVAITKTYKSRNYFRRIIVALFLALPVISTSKSYISTLKNSIYSSPPSTYETDQQLGNSIFSNSLQLVSKDSNSAKDICFFLCAGDQRDYGVRTPLRNLSLHFAKRGIAYFPSLNTKKPLTVYCLLDPSLCDDDLLIESLKEKFPNSAHFTKVDPFTWKVKMFGVQS